MTDPGWARRVRLQQLRTVLAVAQNSSLVKAGEELGLSQPAVSKILHEVEADLGVQLFVRTSRGTHTTPFGEMLANQAKAVFAQLSQVEQEIHNAREGLSGHVSVGALIAGSAQVLPQAVVRLHRLAPGIRTSIREGTYRQLVPALRQGELDMIVGRLPAHRYREGLVVEPFYQEEIHFIVRPGHQALSLRQPDLAALRQWPWILPLPDTTLRQMLEAAFHDLNLELPVAPCESLSVIGNRCMLLETDYICAFPARVIEPDVRAGLLARIDMAEPLFFGPVGVSLRKDSPLSKAAEALLRELRAAGSEALSPF
ncbi:LysR family transcriptional regulator [Isoalcanivorax pacificus W11-5]|uniref:LysR family transcriptional regulator n=2 Tax=Isoalcanivorax TaxID=3020833 RepID=A0A0B4XR08_9GAMM|nr:LysR family transcriptional regulator [Isoalcanivorax pacificus W11-5]